LFSNAKKRLLHFKTDTALLHYRENAITEAIQKIKKIIRTKNKMRTLMQAEADGRIG